MLQFYQYTSMALLGAAVILGLIIGYRVASGFYSTATTKQLTWAAFGLMFIQFVLILVVKWQYEV